MHRILLVDNEATILSVLSTLLKAENYDVKSARAGKEALDIMADESFDLMISDIRMAPIGGMELLNWARAHRPEMSVIMLTAYGTVETAIEAMKVGAFDYVTKPFKVDELLITIRRALEYKEALAENQNLKSRLKTQYRFDSIVAESPSMRAVCEMIERVAPTDATVLICGESGTGKELVAKAIHAHSRRKSMKFLAVNCAALPEPLLESEMFGYVKGAFTGAACTRKGLFEAAGDGTIFLDEIGSMPPGIQGKLLRVLQEKEIRRVGGNEIIPVQARVLAATNSPLEQLMKQGQFREDLYYRLSVINITIEPLRNRPEDIVSLAYHVLRNEMPQGRGIPALSNDVIEILRSYSWPGNVRELENAIKHALAFLHGNEITVDVMPPRILEAVKLEGGPLLAATSEEMPGHQFESLKAFLQKKESDYLKQVIDMYGGDKEKAASMLKISLATLYRKLPREEANK